MLIFADCSSNCPSRCPPHYGPRPTRSAGGPVWSEVSFLAFSQYGLPLITFPLRRMGLESFVTPNDILTGNKNLNLAYCADMFNKYPGIQVQSFDEAQTKALQQAEENLRRRLEEEERQRRDRWYSDFSQCNVDLPYTYGISAGLGRSSSVSSSGLRRTPLVRPSSLRRTLSARLRSTPFLSSLLFFLLKVGS